MNPPTRSTRWRTRTRSSCRRTSSSAARARPACWSCAASCSTNRVPDVVGGGTVAYVNPDEHLYLDDPVHREEGGTPAIVESIRAGLVFQLKDAVGTDVDPRARGGLPAPRGRRVARAPRHRGARQPRGRAALDRVVRRPPARRAATSTTTSSSRCSTTCSASRRAAAARAPARTATGCSASTSSARHEFEREITARLRGHQARLGAGELQLLHLRGGLRLRRRGRRAGRRRGLAAAARLPLRPGAPGCGTTAAAPVEPPLRLPDVGYDADGALHLPRDPRSRRPSRCSREHLADARALFAARAAEPTPCRAGGRGQRPSRSARTSRRCGGSTCPPCASRTSSR